MNIEQKVLNDELVLIKTAQSNISRLKNIMDLLHYTASKKPTRIKHEGIWAVELRGTIFEFENEEEARATYALHKENSANTGYTPRLIMILEGE